MKISYYTDDGAKEKHLEDYIRTLSETYGPDEIIDMVAALINTLADKKIITFDEAISIIPGADAWAEEVKS